MTRLRKGLCRSDAGGFDPQRRARPEQALAAITTNRLLAKALRR